MTEDDRRLVRPYLLANLALTSVTAYFSYAYFHLDEYFQVLEFARFKLGDVQAWSLPWEYTAQMRPWAQPYLYVLVAKGLGIFGLRDPFALAFVFRLLTGLASWGALALFLRTTVPWLATVEEKRLHVRVATLLGFLPYLFVRTSSETASMAAFTAAWAIALEGRRDASLVLSLPRAFLVGILAGLAFEFRFQTVFLALGLFAWLAVIARISPRVLGAMVLGGTAVVASSLLVDHAGYGAWVFPPLTYARTNLLEGVAAFFGADPPFAYAWMLPANLFFPIVVVLLVLAVVAWIRHPRNPLTWTTVPFFLVHNLLSHKEERFLFPMAILATGFVVMAIGPSSGRPLRISAWGWKHRQGVLAASLTAWSTVVMLLLAIWPIGWNHHVRFQRHIYETIGGDLHAYALPDFDLGLPAFHGPVYDVEKQTPEQIAADLDAPGARAWLITDSPSLHTGVGKLDRRATLVWSEVPFFEHPALASFFVRLADGYDAHAKAPLRPIHFRSLYRLDPKPR
ncbi:Mannosyltransferase [Labilithrix luteola]|uniref:Mannosyltransferase n=1 Tax=Labilithrix luteola TaxID=1391654 RepID=A0A0K1PMA5_9BACT|nr:hypothetical protein [Labilithrix luteola]AKU94219.1 Mannosyltransferase [Labilithrix luteola]